MSRSKRGKIVSLTKVKKKTKESKGNLINEVRQKFKNSSRIFYGQNHLMSVALGKGVEDEVAPGLHKVSQILKGPCGLMFTNEKEKIVQKYFDDFIEEDFARAGTEAPLDVTIEAGKITELPGSLEPQLRKLGLPTKLENGIIELLEDFVVCKEGNKISSEQSRILKYFDYRLTEFRLSLLAHWSEKRGFKLLDDCRKATKANNEREEGDEDQNNMAVDA